MSLIETARSSMPEEVVHVAKQEGLDPEKLRKALIAGRVVIPRNAARSFNPIGIGEGLRVKINVNLGTSRDHADLDEELENLLSNLEDLEIWAPVLADGELLSPRMQEERLTWVDASPPESPGVEFRYGLGVSDDGGYIGHNGMFAGYNSSMYYLPSRDATLVVLLNNGTNPAYADLILIELAKVVFPDDIPQHWVEASLE